MVVAMVFVTNCCSALGCTLRQLQRMSLQQMSSARLACCRTLTMAAWIEPFVALYSRHMQSSLLPLLHQLQLKHTITITITTKLQRQLQRHRHSAVASSIQHHVIVAATVGLQVTCWMPGLLWKRRLRPFASV